MRADENVDRAFLQTLFDIGNLFGAAKPAYIFHIAGEILKAGLEGLIVLQGKDGGGNQHRHLLGIAGRLEGRADGYFRLAKSYVSADEAVHGAVILHILLHGLRRSLLIRRILIHERRFQLFLQIRVG